MAFQLSSQPLYRSIWDELILPRPENLKPSWLGLQQVLEERHAYLINELLFRSKYLPGQYFRVPIRGRCGGTRPCFLFSNTSMLCRAVLFKLSNG